MVELGHERIGHLAGAPHHDTAVRRHQSYLEMMAEAGLTTTPEWVVRAGWEAAAGAGTAHRVLDTPRRPTALVVSSSEAPESSAPEPDADRSACSGRCATRSTPGAASRPAGHTPTDRSPRDLPGKGPRPDAAVPTGPRSTPVTSPDATTTDGSQPFRTAISLKSDNSTRPRETSSRSANVNISRTTGDPSPPNTKITCTTA
ncbi:substrate-binding domain-containing protein [Actinokineospora sp. G85]|uniref:substrate-binding domain-containing protein n=1 Tax=Actinokineospora sp. G85 TaxID=3406626 RepID=UPI003C759ECB